jgi:hypothetical protein
VSETVVNEGIAFNPAAGHIAEIRVSRFAARARAQVP